MVIQQDAPFRVHGTAAAGESFSVSFAGDDRTAVADSRGKLEIKFPPHEGTARPRELSVKGGVKISPVWVGDVYIAAGGSAWGRRGRGGEGGSPRVSVFTVEGAGSLLPSDVVSGSWNAGGKASGGWTSGA